MITAVLGGPQTTCVTVHNGFTCPLPAAACNNPYEATAKNQLLDFYLELSKDPKALRSRVQR